MLTYIALNGDTETKLFQHNHNKVYGTLWFLKRDKTVIFNVYMLVTARSTIAMLFSTSKTVDIALQLTVVASCDQDMHQSMPTAWIWTDRDGNYNLTGAEA